MKDGCWSDHPPERPADVLELRNPHSVLAALETRPQAVVEIRLHAQQPSGAWEEVVRRAAAHRIPVQRGVERRIARRESGRRAPRTQQHEPSAKAGRTGAAEALVRPREEAELLTLFTGSLRMDFNPADESDQVLQGADFQPRGRSEHGLWLALDQIQDPHNVGAIFRTAAFFGVEGIVHTRDRSAPMNATVYDVASGGVEYVPFAAPPNLSRALDLAKQAGLWILGSSEHADRDVREVERDRPWLLVLGNEEKGLRRLTLDKCDALCRLSPAGPITSLNVSVAAGVLIAALTTPQP